MSRRALKRHVQQSFPTFSKSLDKNGQLRGARKGEKRVGVGRPKKGARAGERHVKRQVLRASQPVHVVMRAGDGVGSLRSREAFHAIRDALITVAKHEETFHVVQFSVQRTHVHLLVEARDRKALTRGMQAFTISAAKHINACISIGRSERRRGSVFPDRYHARILKTPREVRNCLAYVLGNWRHHGEDQRRDARRWQIDPFSSAVAFEGWKEREHAPGERYLQPPRYVAPLVWPARTWLLGAGWRRHGLISAAAVPGRGDE